MTTLKTIIRDKTEICAIAKKLGLIEVRIFRGVAKGTENTLNLLVKLDPENKQAQYTRSRLLEAYLENKYNCATTVTFAEKLIPFYKNTILSNAILLFEPEWAIKQHFNNTNLSFTPLENLEDDDQLNYEQSQESYLKLIEQITYEWDIANSKAQDPVTSAANPTKVAPTQNTADDINVLADKLNTLDQKIFLAVFNKLSPDKRDAVKHALSEVQETIQKLKGIAQ